MDTKKPLTKIFLSASIPSPERNKIYYDSADIIAIRDSIKALATIIIPKCHLIWGGHPSITPLIRYVLQRMNTNVQSHLTLYQSLYFENQFLDDNFSFENIVLTPKYDTLKDSVDMMRLKMIEDNRFKVGIFIGGMEGIEEEYQLFKKIHPHALILPVASTGAAANILFDQIGDQDLRLKTDYAYMSLFRAVLSKYI